ncbi:acetate--CoA ligase family protein [Magnetovibrio sp. PR-2]|uniref:acetate--CoA ligase family protein n=1 Tax=Magnetovibrio sp. PR-2 TaxID=3120356 RepID=UPI002FCE1D9E
MDLKSRQEVEHAAHDMLVRSKEAYPNADITGFSVQQMSLRPGAQELIIGVSYDPIFGPVIMFGQGGSSVEVVGDRAVALPLLNMALARDLVSRTKVSKLLEGYRDHAAVDFDAVNFCKK